MDPGLPVGHVDRECRRNYDRQNQNRFLHRFTRSANTLALSPFAVYRRACLSPGTGLVISRESVRVPATTPRCSGNLISSPARSTFRRTPVRLQTAAICRYLVRRRADTFGSVDKTSGIARCPAPPAKNESPVLPNTLPAAPPPPRRPPSLPPP